MITYCRTCGIVHYGREAGTRCVACRDENGLKPLPDLQRRPSPRPADPSAIELLTLWRDHVLGKKKLPPIELLLHELNAVLKTADGG